MKIVVLAGGISTERAVSLVTGTGVCRALRENGHRAILVDLFLGLEEVPADLETLFDAPDGLCPDAKIEVEAPDLETVKRVGLEHYRETLGKKMEGLRFLLERCNDGRRKSLFCTAVNLLELEDVEAVIARLEEEFGPEYSPEEQKERGSRAAELFRERAQTRGVSLKLERQRKP